MRFPVFFQIRKVTRICLVHPAEICLLERFPVTPGQCRVCAFEPVAFHKSLDACHGNRCRDQAFLYQPGMDLCCVQPRIFLFDPVNLINCLFCEHSGLSKVGPRFRRQGINPAVPIKGNPFPDRFGLIFHSPPIRKPHWRPGYPPTVSHDGFIWVSFLDHRRDHPEAEPGYLHLFLCSFCFLLLFHFISPPVTAYPRRSPKYMPGLWETSGMFCLELQR